VVFVGSFWYPAIKNAAVLYYLLDYLGVALNRTQVQRSKALPIPFVCIGLALKQVPDDCGVVAFDCERKRSLTLLVRDVEVRAQMQEL